MSFEDTYTDAAASTTANSSDQIHLLGGGSFSKGWIPWIFVGLVVVIVGSWLLSKKR